MKKTLLLLPAVLLLFATGCGQNSQSSSKSDSVRTSQSKKQAKKSLNFQVKCNDDNEFLIVV
ncbi:hypothetical protein [Lacticaseibacillus paracasei]|uniref:hypothetical protein n=1 Tax=Lacticaseibacillus paracasei TaxID=1597 RepID=UPI0021C35C70|nr:hypothetical protein [Lacticaseibacillus paracasei]